MQVPARFIVREGDDDELRVGNDGRPLLLPDLLQTNMRASYLQVGASLVTIYVHICKMCPRQGRTMEPRRFFCHCATAELLI